MKKMSILLCSLVLISSCNKDEEKVVTDTDKQLLEMSVKTDGFTWYKNSDALLDKSSGSAHNYKYLKTRFNAIASTQLDEQGKVKAGAVFPDGSLVVKELRNDATSVARYAVLYKKADHQYADAKGWVWGYVNSDGSVAESASNKGKSCISCHSQAESIDYMLMNKYFK